MRENGGESENEGGSEATDLLKRPLRPPVGNEGGSWLIRAIGTVAVIVVAGLVGRVLVFEYWLPLHHAQEYEEQVNAFDHALNGADGNSGQLAQLVSEGASQITAGTAWSTAITSGDTETVKQQAIEYKKAADSYLFSVDSVDTMLKHAAEDLGQPTLDSFRQYREALAITAADNVTCIDAITGSYTPPEETTLRGVRCAIHVRHGSRYYVMQTRLSLLDGCPVVFRKYVREYVRGLGKMAHQRVDAAYRVSLQLMVSRLLSFDQNAEPAPSIPIEQSGLDEINENCQDNPNSQLYARGADALDNTYPPQVATAYSPPKASPIPPVQPAPEQNHKQHCGVFHWFCHDLPEPHPAHATGPSANTDTSTMQNP